MADGPPGPLARRRVLVTGASSGVGQAVAGHLLARGYEVWGTSRRVERLSHLPGLHPVLLDLADKASVQSAADAVGRDGGVDVLVNNAGSGWLGPLEHADDTVLEAQFRVLVLGPAQLTRALLPDLRRRHGLVINVTSQGGQVPVPFMGPYSAAKAALSVLTDVWQMELPRGDVAFVDIQPGDLRTAFNDSLHCERWSGDERYGAPLSRAWAVLDKGVRDGPRPEVVARAVERFIVRGGHGRALVGRHVHTTLGALAARLLPRSMLLAALRRHYHMD